MNTHTRKLMMIAAAGLIPVLGFAATDTPAPAPAPSAGVRKEVRVLMHKDKDAQLAPATFLGVVALPASPALASQLGLQPGTGLVVELVPEGSPAAGLLQKFDVLQKLDDQLLTDTRQLAVLVRMHKEGDEVALTLLRGGKSQVVKVKLGSRPLPPLDAMMGEGPGLQHRWEPMERDDVDLMLHGLGADPHAEVRIFREGAAPSQRNIVIRRDKRVYVVDDGTHTLQLTGDEGARVLQITDKEGKELFKGPFNTPEERAKLPEQFRKEAEVLDNPHPFMKWHTDEHFEQGPPPPAPAPDAPARPERPAPPPGA